MAFVLLLAFSSTGCGPKKVEKTEEQLQAESEQQAAQAAQERGGR
jgi:hypothetical protein